MKQFYLIISGIFNFPKFTKFIFSVFFILGLAPVLIKAQSITVSTTVDAVDGNTASIASLIGTPGGAGISLREAIIATNNEPVGATITINIPAGSYSLTIGGAGENGATTGDLDLNTTVAAGNKTVSILGAGSATTTITQTIADRIFDVHPVNNTGSITFNASNVKLAGGNITGSGGAMLTGRPGDVTNLTDCIIVNNTASTNGGAISQSSSLASHNLTITNCTFTNNTATGATGGAVNYNGIGNVIITGCTFTGNTSGTQGGAINITGGGTGANSGSITKCTFSGNTANGATFGGAAVAMVSVITININYNRIIGNLAPNVISGKMISTGGGTVGTMNSNNNWWGTNNGPATADILGTAAATWLQLKNTASPTAICVSSTSTITASFLANSAGAAIAAGDLTALAGLPITFNNAVNGTLSSAQASIQSSGTATVTFTGTAAGNGSANAVFVPLAENFTVTTSPTITINGSSITAPTVTQPTCATPTGTIVVNATGSGTLEYQLNSGAFQTSNTFSNLAPGSYDITVRLQSSPTCLSIYSGNPVVLSAATGCCIPPVITAPTVTQPTCATPTGTIVVNATGGGTLEYQLNSGAFQTSNTFGSLAPGSYDIAVRLQSSPTCLSIYSGNPVVLSAATGCCIPPVITAPTVTQPTCATPTGTIVVNATGDGTLEYQLNSGAFQTSNTFGSLAPGSYDIAVRLQSSPTCLSIYSGNPVVLSAATGCCVPPVITAPTVTQPTCAIPTGTIVVNATGGGTLEYQLNSGAFQTSNTFGSLAPGSYDIAVRLQSSPTCLSIYSGNPVVLSAATGCCVPSTAPTGATGTKTICNGENTTLTVAGGSKGTGATTEWFTGSCGGTSAGTGDAITVSPTATTTYYVRYSGDCNTTTCATVMVTVNRLSTAPTGATGTTTICNGENTTLTVAGGSKGTGATTEWFTGSCGGTSAGTGDAITVSPAATTTYYVRYSGDCNTTTCATVTVTVNRLSTAPTGATGTKTICNGENTTLTVAGGSKGTGATTEWFTGSCGGTSAGTGDAITVSPTATTTYYVRYSGDCNTTTCATVTVTVNRLSTAPTGATGTKTICNGENTTLTVAGGSKGTGATTEWFTGSCGGTSAGTGDAITVSPTATTTYYVRYSGTCNTTTCATVTVTVNRLSTAPTGATGTKTICNGENTTLTVAGGSKGTGATTEWFTGSCGGTSAGTGDAITVSPTATTTYYVRYSGDCNTTTCATVTVTVNRLSTAPTGATGTKTICNGENTTLTVAGGSKGTGATTQWFTGSCGGTSAGTGDAITVSPTATTTYYVRYSGDCNTTTCATVTVTVNRLSTAPTGATGTKTICNGENTTLTVAGGSKGTGATTQWFTGSCGGTSAGTGDAITVSPTATTTYYVRYSGACNTTTCATVTVTVQAPVVALANTGNLNFNVSLTNTMIKDDNCHLIATLMPSGLAPVNGIVAAKVTIDATVNTAANGRPYVQRHFDIEPVTNAANATATLTLYFTQAEFDAFNAFPNNGPDIPAGPADATGIANLRIFQFHGVGTGNPNTPATYPGPAVEIDPDDDKVVFNSTLNSWEVTINVTGFSGFFAANLGNNILPVQLVSFIGVLQQQKVMLQWTTSIEINSQYFELQRSINGSNFIKLTSINAEGNNLAGRNYHYADDISSVSKQSHLLWYRLKLVDRDGRFTYSNVIMVNVKNSATIITVSPNPFSRQLMVDIESAQQATTAIRLYDISGKILQEQTVILKAGNNSIRINQLNALASGTYMLQVQNAQLNETIRLLKAD